MKKILFISTVLIAMVASSCKNDLNQLPISSATLPTFYQTPSDFFQGVNAMYSSLRNYPDRLCYLSEIRSDNIYGVSVTVRDWDPINNFAKAIAANTYVEEAWSADFNGVFKANTVLDQITKNGAVIGSASIATRYNAEAKFLRAFYYFDLVRYFGKVPLVDHPLLASEAITVPRSPVADVYKLIIADLQFAITNLPATYTGVDVGRATKYAAEGLLAQVYMARSGPTYGIEGPGLGLSEWNLALPLLQDIINSNLFALNTTSYANIFAYTNQSPVTTGNKEAIFDVMYQSGLSGSASLYGADFVWQLTPNGYFLSLKDTKSNGSLEIIPVSADLAADYAAADARKAATIYTAGYTQAGSTEIRPFFKKWVDITKIPTTSRFDWGINYIAIRYTDVLLLKAECVLNGAPGNTVTDVDGVVNAVRARSGLTTPLVGVTLDQLLDERRKEFANEGLRWFDLQRSGKLLTIMNAWRTKEDTQGKINTVIPGYVVYPVPQSQLDAVPGLYTQNTGY